MDRSFLHGMDDLIGICLLKQWGFVLGGKTSWTVPTCLGRPDNRNTSSDFSERLQPDAGASIHSEFLNCIFCEGRYYNGMHYITLGGQMSETMRRIIAEWRPTGWSSPTSRHLQQSAGMFITRQLVEFYCNFIIISLNNNQINIHWS